LNLKKAFWIGGEMKLLTKTLVLLVALVLFSVAGFAATFATGTNTVSPTMKVNVTVQSAVQLTLSNGASGTHCIISAGAPEDYSINFGNVNGLGVGTPTCGTVSTTAADATYVTDYQLTPSFSGFVGTTASIAIGATAFSNPGTLTLKEGAAAGSVAAVPVAPAVVLNNATSGTPITRYLGVTVKNQNGAGAFTGADSSVVTFTLTVP
jgi:hypothetical protein